MPHVRLASPEELLQVAGTFPEVHLFFGYGAKAQYADTEEVLWNMRPYLDKIKQRCMGKPWLAVYGGDPARPEQPDLGWLMKRVQDEYDCKLLGIQSHGTPDTHTDYCFVAETQYETVTRTNADGKTETSKEILWGGTRDGRPVGGARYYLGDDFIRARGGRPALLTAVFVMGGGGVALEEIQYADVCELAWVYIPCRARNEKPYGSTYGPVHEWVRERLDKGPSQGRKYTCVPGPVAA